MAVKPIPEGYQRLTPMLVVNDAHRQIDFIKRAFGAEERMLVPMPGNKVAHSELVLGDSLVMVSDATPQFVAGGASDLFMYVENVDEVYKRALAAGATSEMEPADMFYGDRTANVRDPLGNRWSLSTHVDDVSEEEMTRRMKSMGMA